MSVYVGFVVDQWLLFRFYLEYFGFPLSLLFHQCSILIIHSSTIDTNMV